ncbi:Methyltransferase type 11 [Kribbella flavida DSM 17836]|uniref:Methyltransferase type 11 n=1 Tax=Kribbella flavida (strain DSM 17836 / JCM 10339 / NBRC 14399) TaxID=479435 RepID=D2PMT9_KRIFD|nr:class I SAM-dependent methyltransferase [Kribbella flavida]ADB32641.1 Methyltransferase type 11 [Kribbella flavida DSM 17836]
MSSYLDTTRASYDTVAADYHTLVAPRFDDPFHRAVIGLLGDLLAAGQGGPVGDLGCGPGHVTAYLAELGMDAFGVDLSPEMVAVARTEYPGLRFETGSLLGLDLPDGELAGALAFYSLVHTPAEDLPTAFAEIHRVLAPGGLFLYAFKSGNDRYHLTQGYGHPLELDVYCYEPARIHELLAAAGFGEVATLTRPALDGEKTAQAFLIVRKPQ